MSFPLLAEAFEALGLSPGPDARAFLDRMAPVAEGERACFVELSFAPAPAFTWSLLLRGEGPAFLDAAFAHIAERHGPDALARARRFHEARGRWPLAYVRADFGGSAESTLYLRGQPPEPDEEGVQVSALELDGARSALKRYRVIPTEALADAVSAEGFAPPPLLVVLTRHTRSPIAMLGWRVGQRSLAVDLFEVETDPLIDALGPLNSGPLPRVRDLLDGGPLWVAGLRLSAGAAPRTRCYVLCRYKH